MKKFLSLVMMWVVALNAFASLVCTFDPAVDIDQAATYRIVPFHLSKDGVDIEVSKGYITAVYYIPLGESMTVSTQTGKITGMVIEFNISNNNGPDGFVSSTGNYTVTENYGIWEGQSQSVTLKAEYGYIYIKKLTVYVDGDGTMSYPPSISPLGGDFYDPFEVTMFCPIAGSVIHYTTDGSEPTTASAVYDGPITVSENCTVSAISVIDDQVSDVQSQTYNFRQHEFGLGDIQGLEDGTEVTLDYDATVLYADYYIYFLQDETGYAALNITRNYGYNDGDVIRAGYKATKTSTDLYMPELKDGTRLRRAPYPKQPIARQVTIQQLGGCMPGEFVVLRDVTLNPYSRTLTDSHGNYCHVYQDFYFPTVVDDGEYEYEPSDEYVIVLNDHLVYLTKNIHYYGLGYDFSGLRDDDEVRLRFNTTVLYQHGDYLFVKDCTGYGLIYGPTERTYCTGDVIPPEIYVNKTMADGEVLLKNPKNLKATLSGHENVVPEDIQFSDMNHEHWAHLVALHDVTVSDLDGADFVLTDANGNTCHGNNTFEQPLIEGHYDVLRGIVGSHEMPNGQIEYRLLPILPTDTAEVSTIAELLECPSGQVVRITEPLTAIYQNGAYLYVRDCVGDETLIYGDLEESFENGDIIVNALARWSTENLTPSHMYYPYYAQLVMPVSGWTVAAHGEPVKPTPVTIADVNAGLLHHYIELQNVYRVSSNELKDKETGARLTLHNMFNISYPEDRTIPYDVICFGAFYYSTSWNVFPIKFREHVVKGDVNGDGEVNIADVSSIIDVILTNDASFGNQMDVNGDGEVNIADVNAIIDIILK